MIKGLALVTMLVLGGSAQGAVGREIVGQVGGLVGGSGPRYPSTGSAAIRAKVTRR